MVAAALRQERAAGIGRWPSSGTAKAIAFRGSSTRATVQRPRKDPGRRPLAQPQELWRQNHGPAARKRRGV